MTWEEAAAGFAAVGSEARLQVLRVLVRAGDEGISVAEVQERTGIAPSTLAHHLKFLAGAGVIAQERVGRMTVNRARFDHLRAMADFLLHECCADSCKRAANDG